MSGSKGNAIAAVRAAAFWGVLLGAGAVSGQLVDRFGARREDGHAAAWSLLAALLVTTFAGPPLAQVAERFASSREKCGRISAALEVALVAGAAGAALTALLGKLLETALGIYWFSAVWDGRF